MRKEQSKQETKKEKQGSKATVKLNHSYKSKENRREGEVHEEIQKTSQT